MFFFLPKFLATAAEPNACYKEEIENKLVTIRFPYFLQYISVKHIIKIGYYYLLFYIDPSELGLQVSLAPLLDMLLC